MNICRYQDSDASAWDAFIRESKNGTFLFLRNYMDYNRDHTDDHSLCIYDDKNRLVSVLPANRTGNTLYSHGRLTFGGFITNTQMRTLDMLTIFEECIDFLKLKGFDEILYRTIPYIYHKAPAQEDLYALFSLGATVINRRMIAMVDLQQPLPIQERRRRGAKKARNAQISIRQTTDFAAYWVLLTEVLQTTYQTNPVHRLDEIELLHRRFPHAIQLYCAYHENVPIAGVVMYVSDQVARAQYIASNDTGKAMGALDLLFEILLTDVFPSTHRYFEFGTSEIAGTSTVNAGLLEQKEGFGARVIAQDIYRITLT
ncbi:MAG: GNAT family N-acetyltransferase [Chloroflexota bacterium]|nr:GNAT family N-acetyltransferase [Chloroflexota bacterium]